MSGQEHCVWFSEDSRRVFKATKPNKFGLTVGDRPTATPLEYFQRMTLTNQIFGDDIIFEGVAKVAGKIRVVISQPFIYGEVPQPEEVVSLMETIGFKPLEIDAQPAWYRAEDNVLAFDTHTKNFMKTSGGLLPIDVNLHQPDQETKIFLLDAVAQFAAGLDG